MSEEITIEIDEATLEATPVFPLPGTVLLPGTLVSLHVFEPRYRQMMAYCLEGHRVLAVAMFDEDGQPDIHGRPPVHPVAGLGYVRRSARLPDGRYNVVLEGVARIDVSDEHPPKTAFRRVRARMLADVPHPPDAECRSAAHALRALASRALTERKDRADLQASLTELEPGRLADAVAAAVVDDPLDRQRVLDAIDVKKRLSLVSGAVGAMMFDVEEEPPEDDVEPRLPRWGVTPGKA